MQGGARCDSTCALQAVVCGLGTGSIASQSCLSRFRTGPSIKGTDAPHCMLTSWVFWSISADVTRGARGPLRMHSRFLKANEEAGAFVWTVVRGGRPLGARGGFQNTGHKDETYGVAETSSTRPVRACAPTALPRLVRRVRTRLGRDRPAISISIDCAEQLPAPLLIVFENYMCFWSRY